MGGDYHQQFTSDTQEQPVMSSGLSRYQSAPSSYFATLLNITNSSSNINDLQNCIVNSRPSTPPTDQVIPSRFMSPGNFKGHGRQLHGVPPQNSSVNKPPTTIHSHFMAASAIMNNTSENQILYTHHQQQLLQGRSSSSSGSYSQMISDNQSQPSIPNHRSNPVMDCSFLPPINMGGGANTNLLRQSSSPADFFANFDIEGYGVSKIMGNFGLAKTNNSEAASVPSPSTPDRLKRELDYSTVMTSSSGIMTPISEIEKKNMEMSDGFPSWDAISDGFLKGLEDDDSKQFTSSTALDNQNDEVGNHQQQRPPSMLSHHLSLPKASMEKLLQLQDSVPCKIRAKRGCATHPRSIAERVRRTRISERMRKLQELVPNMDKQTNTSDMLDLAVDYIKDLRDQVQVGTYAF